MCQIRQRLEQTVLQKQCRSGQCRYKGILNIYRCQNTNQKRKVDSYFHKVYSTVLGCQPEQSGKRGHKENQTGNSKSTCHYLQMVQSYIHKNLQVLKNYKINTHKTSNDQIYTKSKLFEVESKKENTSKIVDTYIHVYICKYVCVYIQTDRHAYINNKLPYLAKEIFS